MNVPLPSFRLPRLIVAAIGLFTAAHLFGAAAAPARYTPPQSPRATYNFNPDWKFIKSEAPYSERVNFNDSSWQTVSTPHTYNDTDSFDGLITRGGEVEYYTGGATYRKKFKLPASAANGKVFLEFEGLRQAAFFYVNGQFAGKYENGVTPTGLDITQFVKFDGSDNVLNAKVTNVTNYAEESSGAVFQWESRDFNPNYGGLNQNVWLHLTGKVYQTLPLLDGLGTTGVYIYPQNISVAGGTCDVSMESQVRNESGAPQTVALSAVVVDKQGVARAQLSGETKTLAAGDTTVLKAAGKLSQAQWWSPEAPHLYDVYSVLMVNGSAVDVCKTETGFRKTDFRGGAGTGGVFINDKFTYLKGYAIRSTNEWAALGGAYPDWLRDYTVKMIRDGHGNYIRWMHIAPKPADSRACDRFGIVQVTPAGDKEADVQGAQWRQRVDVMRKTIVYFRNSPSVLLWEAGNQVISRPHMEEMVALRKELDPSGGRIMGTRHGDNSQAAAAITDVTEWYGTMIGQDRGTNNLSSPAAIFRGYSDERRDRGVFIETEDFRPESARRFWDAYSPPHFGAKQGPQDLDGYFIPSQEAFVLAGARRYWEYASRMISNPNPKVGRWSAYASIIFADSNQHGRMQSSEVARVSGKVDAVRLPKPLYFVHRVMQNEQPDIEIVGHWTYPAGTKKTVYVAGNHLDQVELFVNGKSIGKSATPRDGYIYEFENVAFEPGALKAVGTKDGKVVATQTLETAGPPVALKLTPHTNPLGLQADGSDVAFFDVEAVDAQGRRCPTDEERVDFSMTGPATWRGGYNSGVVGSIGNTFLNTECGINRVFVRSTLTPGEITLTATRTGLKPATVTIASKPVKIENGLEFENPPLLPAPFAAN